MDKLGVYLSCLSIRCLCIANINHLLRSSRTSGMWNVFDPCKSLKQELQYLCQARLRNFLIFVCLFLIQLLSPLISSALRMGCWRPYQIPKRHTTFSLCHLVSPAFESVVRWGSRADIKLNLALEHTWIIAKVNMYCMMCTTQAHGTCVWIVAANCWKTGPTSAIHSSGKTDLETWLKGLNVDGHMWAWCNVTAFDVRHEGVYTVQCCVQFVGHTCYDTVWKLVSLVFAIQYNKTTQSFAATIL